VLGEHTFRPAATRWAMIRDTASRQLWSSLRTWLRKPQMVVTGLNSRSRYLTPCSLRASRMLAWVKESANGSPWSRANRARTSCRFIIYGSKIFLIGGGGRRGRLSLRKEKQRQGTPPPSIVRGSAWGII